MVGTGVGNRPLGLEPDNPQKILLSATDVPEQAVPAAVGNPLFIAMRKGYHGADPGHRQEDYPGRDVTRWIRTTFYEKLNSQESISPRTEVPVSSSIPAQKKNGPPAPAPDGQMNSPIGCGSTSVMPGGRVMV